MVVDSKKALKMTIKLLISLLFVVWLIFKVDWKQVLQYISAVDIFQIGIYVLVLLLGIMISSVKWKMLLAYKHINISLKECFQLYLTGTLINNFLPSFIGGDTYRAYHAGKKNQKFSAAASSVVVDRISGMIAAMAFTLLFFVLNFKQMYADRLLFVINIANFAGLILFFILIKMKFPKKIKEAVPQKLRALMKDFEEYGNINLLFKVFLMSMLFSFVGLALVNYVLFFSLGIKISLMNYFSVIFLISIISSLPISINNIGIKEWAYITFFGLFGISSSAVISVAIISRFLQMIVSLLAIPFYIRNK